MMKSKESHKQEIVIQEEDLVFSIIVPIYNVEAYLSDCIESIIKQQFARYEIILVDDGSPDQCPKICDEYKGKDKRIKVIHKINGGLSSARNAGLQIAKGKYILFVDSDDLIAENSLNDIYKCIVSNNYPDVIFLEATKFYFDNHIEPMGDGYTHENIDNKKYEDVLAFVEKMPKFPGSACTKAIKNELLDDKMMFIENLISEDNEWTIRLFGKARSFAYCDSPYYLYRQQREGSITDSVSTNVIDSMLFIIEQHSYRIVKNVYQHFCNVACSYILMILLYNLGNKKKWEDVNFYKKVDELSWIMKYSSSKKTRITALILKIFGTKCTSKMLNVYIKSFRKH